ncbi:MAG: NAD(P)H-dependent oxidoreductase [Clostridia bacterium]|nr:NAD(P)H-dependent oxidoreductase [Clostridia bacterium]
MKTAVVYYSMSGNTEYAAGRIADSLGADLIRIEPVKTYPDSGARKFFWGGKSAVMGEKPQLKPYAFAYSDYDRIVFGTPVWASTFAPPIRTFIEENRAVLKGKKIAVFTCSMGGGADKVVEKLKKFLAVEEFEETVSLIEPKNKPTPDNERAIDIFCLDLKNTR